MGKQSHYDLLGQPIRKRWHSLSQGPKEKSCGRPEVVLRYGNSFSKIWWVLCKYFDYFFDQILRFVFTFFQFPQIFARGPAVPAKLEKLQAALGILDGFIGNNDYATGDTLTLADLALVSSVSTFEISGIDITGHKNVVRWYDKVKATAPGYVEANEMPLQKFKALIESRLKQK